MSADVFLDTNITIHGLAQNDPRFQSAVALIRAGGIISVQVPRVRSPEAGGEKT